MMQVLKISRSVTSFCLHMFWLMLSSLLLMADCFSAVPHQHLTTRAASGFQPGVYCSNDFSLYNEHCYRYFGLETKRAFYHAEKQCTHFHSTLVSLLSPSEEEFVVQLTDNNTAFWIGLNDDEGPNTEHTEGVFKWTSGEKYSEMHYQKWKSGEPNNRKHLDCVKVDASGWAMATGGCASSKLPFVCKKKACPHGLEWDGKSCDIVIIDSGNSGEGKSLSDRSISMSRRWTLTVMLVSSLVVIVIISIAAKKSSQRACQQTMTSTLRHDLCEQSEKEHKLKIKNLSFSRVEDLLPPT